MTTVDRALAIGTLTHHVIPRSGVCAGGWWNNRRDDRARGGPFWRYEKGPTDAVLRFHLTYTHVMYLSLH